MTIDFSFLSILDILSIATAFMLGLLFITSKSNNRKANLFLGLFLWSLSVEVFDSFSQSVQDFSFTLLPTSLYTIPFLLLYIRQTLNIRFSAYSLLLFVPGILINFFEFPSFLEYVFNISILIYLYQKLKTHQKTLGDFYSDTENKTLAWIKTILYIFLFFHCLWIVEDIIGIQNEDWTEYFAFASNVLTFFMIYWIGYNGFSQSEIFTSLQFQAKEIQSNSNTIEEDIDSKKQFEKMNQEILEKKFFTDIHLNLRTLSVLLNMKEKEVSRLINLHTNANFYHFINQFRVDEFKELLSSPKIKHLSILGLAEEAGFSSKSTFYAAFKKIEGITPKQYQDQIKKSE